MSDFKRRATFALYGVEFSIGGPMTSFRFCLDVYDLEEKANFYAEAPWGRDHEVNLRTMETRYFPKGMVTIESLYFVGYAFFNFFKEFSDPRMTIGNVEKRRPDARWVLDHLRVLLACNVASANSSFTKMIEAYGIVPNDHEQYYIYIDGIAPEDTTEALQRVLTHIFWKFCCLSDDIDAAEAAFDILKECGLVKKVATFPEETEGERKAWLLQKIHEAHSDICRFDERMVL